MNWESDRYRYKAFELLWKNVSVTSSCWLYTGNLDKDGYGTLTVTTGKGKYKFCRAHRLMYQLAGKVIDKETLDHLCRVRNCVNPSHLEPKTIAENVLSGFGISAQNARKNTCKRGHMFSSESTRIKQIKNKSVRVCKECCRLETEKRRRNKGVRQSKGKSHCLNGHEYTVENTYTKPNGARNCRTCKRERRYASYGT